MTKKLFTFLLTLAASLGLTQAEVYSGTCGGNLTWKLTTADSTLTIDGYGNMDEWGYFNFVPWNTYRSCIKQIIFPAKLTSIGNYAFCDCPALREIIIPDGVKTCGIYSFDGCVNLSSVTIGKVVKTIAGWAFRGCSSLHDIYIPDSVQQIGESAFHGCIALTSAQIGSGISNISKNAFYNCYALKEVILASSTPPALEHDAISKDCLIYVPIGALNKYRQSSEWKNYDVRLFDLAKVFNGPRPTSFTLTFKATIGNKDVSSKISSCGIEEGEEFNGNVIEFIGLEPESQYNDVPLYIRTIGNDYDTIHYSFTTTALELTTKPSKTVSATTAILLAETNMSDAEVSCGFEYKRNDAPADMAGTKVFCPVANGQMAGRLKNLKDDVYYKYRAFYQSAAGKMYYGDWQYIFTGDNAVEFDPILYTYTASVVTETGATLSGYALAGSEDFTEQGFEYWAESRTNSGANAPRRMTAALNEHFFAQANGIKMTVTLTNLDEGTVYKYRAYGKVGNQYYYGSEQTFTTQGEWQEGQGIDEVPSDQVQNTKAQKILRNGQIFILRGEKVYNAQGTLVK